jgi:hypothetical protein
MHNIDQMTDKNGPLWSAVAVGDFNTLREDSPNPFDNYIHQPSWKNYLYDAEAYARRSPQNPSLPYIPPGTYYYGKEDSWSPLDRIVVTRNLIDQQGMEFAPESYRLLFPQFMSFNLRRNSSINNDDDGTMRSKASVPAPGVPGEETRIIRVPFRYNFDTTEEAKRGFSDHLPVIFKLRQ